MQDLERRQKHEAEAEERKRARKAEHDAAARERAARERAQEAAHEQQLQVNAGAADTWGRASTSRRASSSHISTVGSIVLQLHIFAERCGTHGVCVDSCSWLTKLKVTCWVSVQALAPKLESMEAAWAGLHTLTGADMPEEIIAFLKGAFAARTCIKTWLTVHLHCSTVLNNMTCIRLASPLGALQIQQQELLASWAACHLRQPIT